MLQPDFKEFSRLAREATLVPVVKSVTADLLTPVSAFQAIADGQTHAFLLESIERGEQIGRYTFLGAAPYMRVKAHRGIVEIQRGRKREIAKGNIFEVIKRLLHEHRPATVPGLPPFTAGAVGYFAYDVIRQLENIGEHAKDDLSVPGAELMFFDRLLAFDHLRHQIHIVAAADVSRESPRRAYDRALKDIASIERKLARGLSPALWRKSAKSKAGKLKVHFGTTREEHMRRIERCKEYIAAGDIFQVVLSQRLDFKPEIAPFDLYRALGRNDLGRVSEYGSVKVKDLMFVERYSHVMHLVSALEGTLRKDLDAIDAFTACFPAGTLSGAPKVRAMQIIEELEPTRRGVYGGSVLYADFAGNLDSCIGIRTMLMQGKKAYLQAGGGIVADSDPATEFQESMNKAGALLRAVEMARSGNS